MKKIGWFSRLSSQQPSPATIQRISGSMGAALLIMTGIAAGQNLTPGAPPYIPDGYTIHQSMDLGGHIDGIKGSGAMYDTLINLHSGPRVLGESFEMRALPNKKNTLFDSLQAVGSGFGGDPNVFARMAFSKGKIYEFSGNFRRDRQYFDYDLLGNPNIPPMSAPTGSFALPQVNQSPVLYNTVRRMTDTSVTIFPLSTVTFRAGYSQNIFQGPSLSPSGYQFATGNAILSEFQRNSTDDFIGAIDWKPAKSTKLTFEEEIDHYKADSFFTMAPGDFTVQEADGTPAALDNFDSVTPLKISCDTFAQGSSTVLSASTSGGLPVISPYCSVVTSYSRRQPTRILYPTEIFHLQNTSIRNVAMNGDFRYTKAKMNLPNYYDSFQGLSETAVKATKTTPASYYGVRSMTYTGIASAQREAVAADYGIVWQALTAFSLSDQVSFSNVHQPGTTTMTSLTTVITPSDTAVSFGNASINSNNLTTVNSAAGASTFEGSGVVGTPWPAYFGQRFLTNNLTGSWDASSRATLSLTYRHGTHMIAENVYSAATSTVPVDPGGNPGNNPLAAGATTNGTVTINEDGGIFNAAVRPSANWSVNGTVEALYADNAFTPVGPRQTRHYRVHTLYRPKPWATLSGAWNDLERHNNTNNNQATVALFVPPSPTITPATPTGTASSGTPYEGPLQHVDHSRMASFGAVIAPNEHYGFDVNYAYTDVYAATNICYLNGATASLPGAVQSATSTLCPNIFGRGATGVSESNGSALSDWFARDFMDAPTQYASLALSLSPVKTIHTNLGYRISAVSGSQFFNDARAVNGSLVSRYQSPYMNLAWTVHPGWIWRADYNYYSYGEGGPSGSQYCSTSTATTSTAVLCSSLPYPTGVTESPSGLTAPRNFHANNVTLGMHYEF